MTRKLIALSALGLLASAAAAFSQGFTPGDLVISTVYDNIPTADGDGLDTASPIVLDDFTLSNNGTKATADGSLTLPQSSTGSNNAISGEYGSASEGILQDSANGQYLTMMGYGVVAATFNADTSLGASSPYGTAALGQTTSLTAANQTGTTVTTVPRVVALIGADGSVDTSTALTGVYNTNNPRSAATIDGSTFYVSGQGATVGDTTEGVWYATRGASTATPIDNQTTDTRTVSILNINGTETLFVSRDAKPSGSNETNISTLTGGSGGLPTSATGLTTTHVIPPATLNSASGNNGSINLNPGILNGVNNTRYTANNSSHQFVYLSPEQFFMASPTVMYVADSGQPKNGSTDAAGVGEGGLQKWVYSNGAWTLDYDLVAGLSLVNNDQAASSTPGDPYITGLLGLTGEVTGNNVELFATSYGLNELSNSYLYEITDSLSATSITDSTVANESFTAIYDAPSGTSIRGVAFAPTAAVPEPSTWATMLGGLGLLGALARNRRHSS